MLFVLEVSHISLASLLLLVQVQRMSTDTIVRKHVLFSCSLDAAMQGLSTWSRFGASLPLGIYP